MRKLTKDEINDVLKLSNEMQKKHKDYRKGQAFFNSLHRLYPDVANKIRGTDKDPFYIDEKVNECIAFVKK